MSELKKHPRGAGRGICGGVGYAHTTTYTGPPLAVDLFSVDSLINIRLIRLRVQLLHQTARHENDPFSEVCHPVGNPF